MTMPKTDLVVQQIAVSALVPYKANARTHSRAQVAQIAASIREFGWTNPILADESMTVLAGHGRLKAAKLLGMSSVPVLVLRGLTETKRRALILADNKLAMNAGWNTKLLATEIQAIMDDGYDIDLAGFDQNEIDKLCAGALDGLDQVTDRVDDLGVGAPEPQDISLPTFERPTIRFRNGVAFVTVRSWRQGSRVRGSRNLKAAKACLDPRFVAGAVADLREFCEQFYGAGQGLTVTNVACGHSRRSDCLSKQIAIGLASSLGTQFVQVFEDRFLTGVSHPKECRNATSLAIRKLPDTFTIVCDDVATSGWHVEEAVSTLRGRGIAAAGVVWIGREADDSADRDSGQ